MTTKGHCESSLGSFDECSAAHKWLSTLRPSHLTWAVSPPVFRQLASTTTIAIYYYYSSRKADTHLPSHGGYKAELT